MNKIPTLNNVKEVANFLKDPAINYAETVIGFLTSGPKYHALVTGRVVSSVIKFNLLTQLGRELEGYRKKGEIKENYFATNKNKASLKELLEFIDNNAPDEEVFRAMKSIFFTSVAKTAKEKDEILAYELLLICKKLTSFDILVLKACYAIYLKNDPIRNAMHSHGDWVRTVTAEIGIGYEELTGVSEDHLLQLNLLTERTNSDRSGIRKGREFRLSSLGLKFCEYITNYE